jgi:hypothetical protein
MFFRGAGGQSVDEGVYDEFSCSFTGPTADTIATTAELSRTKFTGTVNFRKRARSDHNGLQELALCQTR